MKRAQCYKGFRELTAAVHLHTAVAERTPVIVFHGEEMIGSGVIDEITDFSVRIRNERYVRGACRFVYVK